MTSECGAVASAVDPAMFYWTGHGENEVYKKTWSKTWEEIENSKLPPEVIDEIPDAQVFGVTTCHVGDLTMYGDREFLERLTEMIQKKFARKPPEKNNSVVCGLGVKRELLKDGKVIMRTSSGGYEDKIKEVEMSPEAQLDKNRLLNPEEVAAFQKQLGMLLWLVRLTRADLGFEAASASQKIGGDQEFLQEYDITNVSRTKEAEEEERIETLKQRPFISSLPPAASEAAPSESNKEKKNKCGHMPGFKFPKNNEKVEEVNKVNIYKAKKPVTGTHLKVKNVLWFNKTVKKMRARRQMEVNFTDVCNGDESQVQIQVHTDSGSIRNMEGYKAQTGIVGILCAKNALRMYDSKDKFIPHLNNKAKNQWQKPAYIEACPIMWMSNKSERVATSSFSGEIQAVDKAIDVGCVLKTLYSELLKGHPRGDIPVIIKNDNLSLVHDINSITAVTRDKRMNATLASIRGAINDRIVHEVSWISGLFNVANGLTKDSDTGNNIHYLLAYNKLAVSTKKEDEDRQYRMDIGKQYLLSEKKLLGASKQDKLATIAN